MCTTLSRFIRANDDSFFNQSSGNPNSQPTNPNQANQPASIFGQPNTSQPATFGFGSTGTTVANTASGPATLSPGFGSAPTSFGQPSSFGQPFGQQPSTFSGFGTNAAPSGSGGFGIAPASSQPTNLNVASSTGGFGKPTGSFGFGIGSSTTANAPTNAATAPAAGSFGTTPSFGFGSGATGFSGGFGSSTISTNPPTTGSVTSNLFGSSPANLGTNTFSNLATTNTFPTATPTATSGFGSGVNTIASGPFNFGQATQQPSLNQPAQQPSSSLIQPAQQPPSLIQPNQQQPSVIQPVQSSTVPTSQAPSFSFGASNLPATTSSSGTGGGGLFGSFAGPNQSASGATPIQTQSTPFTFSSNIDPRSASTAKDNRPPTFSFGNLAASTSTTGAPTSNATIPTNVTSVPTSSFNIIPAAAPTNNTSIPAGGSTTATTITNNDKAKGFSFNAPPVGTQTQPVPTPSFTTGVQSTATAEVGEKANLSSQAAAKLSEAKPLFALSVPPSTNPLAPTKEASSGASTNLLPSKETSLVETKKENDEKTKDLATIPPPKPTVSLPGSVTFPSLLKNKTLEEIVGGWKEELEAQVFEFQKQAITLGQWDRKIIKNGENIISLNERVIQMEVLQQELDQNLAYVSGQQAELEGLLDGIERELGPFVEAAGQNAGFAAGRISSMGGAVQPADEERDRMYENAENLQRLAAGLANQLTKLVEEINASSSAGTSSTATKEFISHGDEKALLNKTTREDESNYKASGNEQVVQIVQILNTHLDTLQWIDQQVEGLRRATSTVSRMSERTASEHDRIGSNQHY